MAMKYTTRGPLKPVGRPDAGFFVDGDGLLCTFDGRFVRDIFSRRIDAGVACIDVTGHRGGLIVDAHVPDGERLDDGEPQPERRGRPLSEWQPQAPGQDHCNSCGTFTGDRVRLMCLVCEVRERGKAMARPGDVVCSGCGRPLLTHGGAPVPCCCGADNPTNPAAVQQGGV